MNARADDSTTWQDRILGILGTSAEELTETIRHILAPKQELLQEEIDKITAKFIEDHPEFVQVAIAKDPKLKERDPDVVKELLVDYPGVIAFAVHEIAHALHKHNARADIIEAEHLASAAKSRTGIDISPGTQIGKNFFIDHGTSTVIGDTTVIGNNTMIMHKVTLGAYINPQEKRPEKLKHRHPQIGDDCFISVGVEVLGNVKVGNNVTIGPKAMLSGNNIIVHDDVKIGTGVEINDGCEIAKGRTIHPGAFIHKGTGLIDKDIAPNSEVFRDEKGVLQEVDGVPERLRKSRAAANAEGLEFSI